MKKALLALLSIVIVLGSINLFKRITENADRKVKLHIYNETSGNIVESIFRTIPIMYDTMIDIEIVEPFSEEIILYRVNNDIYGGTPDLHYVTYNRINGHIRELKSVLLVRKQKNIEFIDYDTILASLIDINVFRDIFGTKAMNREKIAEKYAELLANSLDTTDFKKIKNQADILAIQNFHAKTESPMINENKTISDFSFIDRLEKYEFLYWFYDHGFVKFTVTMKDDHLTDVKTLRLGNLGVEILHM